MGAKPTKHMINSTKKKAQMIFSLLSFDQLASKGLKDSEYRYISIIFIHLEHIQTQIRNFHKIFTLIKGNQKASSKVNVSNSNFKV